MPRHRDPAAESEWSRPPRPDNLDLPSPQELALSSKDEQRATTADAPEHEPGVRPGALSALLQEIASAPPAGLGGWSGWLRPGAVIGRFELVREIGRGGFGVVWEARDQELGRSVAFKAVRAGEEPGLREERLLREAEVAARLSHPNIVTLHDVGRSEQGPYLVLELLRGETLALRLARGPVPAAEAWRIGVEVASGLAHAHQEGVVHRDLKPGNVFLCADGRVKVLDFGMAHAFGRRKTPGGTPAYMAPEQWRGAPEDERTDVFAFGVLLFQMLSSEVPFPDDPEAAIPFDEPAPPLELPSAPGLCALVAQMLENDPVHRPRDGGELLGALMALGPEVGVAPPSGSPPERAWQRPPPPTSRPISASSTRSRRRRRRRARAKWIAAIVAAAGAVVFASAHLGSLLRARVAAPPLPSTKELAVLPFRSIPEGAAEQAQSAGLGEVLTNRLSQVEQFQPLLRVVSAQEVQKEKIHSAKDARDAFGATLALNGTFQWDAERVRVQLSLVDTGSRVVLRAGEVEAPRGDAPELQRRLVVRVAEMLQLELTGAAQTLAPEPNATPGAYEFYLQGRGYLQRYDRVENLESAEVVFDQALARDPRYALAWAGKAETWLRRYTLTRDPRSLLQARECGQRALELDGDQPAVQLTMGLVHVAAGEHAEAIGRFQKALELEPGSADAHRALASAYAAAGRQQEAEATYRRAIELHPTWAAYKDLGVFYYGQGRLQEALSVFQRVVELTPDNYSGYSNVGAILLQLGRHEEAARMLEKSLTLRTSDPALSNLASVYFYQHRYPEAAAQYRKAAELNPTDARLWGSLGDAERWSGLAAEAGRDYRRAIALLEKEVAINPRNAETRSRLGMHRSALGEREGALSDIAEGLRLSPRDGQVLYRAALVFEEQGMRDRAIEAVSTALAQGFSREAFNMAPPLQSLREDARYRALVEGARAAGLGTPAK
jgi:serine/threonine protein kinase/tetratricopeptide (TPR) repeat protein